MSTTNAQGNAPKPTNASGNSAKANATTACRVVDLSQNANGTWKSDGVKVCNFAIDIERNTKYFNRLLSAPAWEKIKSLKISDKSNIIELLTNFATIQDNIYAIRGSYSYDKPKNESLLDDLLEIAYIYNAINANNITQTLVLSDDEIAGDANLAQDKIKKTLKDSKLKNLLSAAHDAWAYARFVSFDSKFDIVNFKESTKEVNDKSKVTFTIDNKITSVFQLKRLPQLIEFDDLYTIDEEEALKDAVPLIAYYKIINDGTNIATVQDIHNLIFPTVQAGGRKNKKSKQSKASKSKPVASKKQSGGCGGGMCVDQ